MTTDMATALPDTATLIEKLRELPAMPQVVAELIASLDDDDADLDSLSEKISRDQALASKTLRIANSPFFGMAGHIGSVREATTVLGLRTIRSIALASAVASVSSSSEKLQLDARSFWLHSFETAAAARELASVSQISPDQAFLGGLLHDLGKLALCVIAPDIVARVEALGGETESAWYTAEQQGLIPAHAELGGALAEQWRFPAPLCAAIAGHHSQQADGGALAATVHVADILSQAHAAACGRSLHIDPLIPAAWARFADRQKILARAVGALRRADKLAALMH